MRMLVIVALASVLGVAPAHGDASTTGVILGPIGGNPELCRPEPAG